MSILHPLEVSTPFEDIHSLRKKPFTVVLKPMGLDYGVNVKLICIF